MTLAPPVGRSPLVGREAELVTLGERLAAARAGAGGVALVGGEPGIGKTRLLLELAEQARAAGWLVLGGAAYDAEGMPPYLPFVEALQHYARTRSTEDLQAQLGASAPDVALLVPEVRQRLLHLPSNAPLDAENARYRLFESVTDFLLTVARAPGAAGLLLWLEDLHWADEVTLLLLEHLGRRIADAPLLVVASYRDTELDVGGPLAHTLERLARQGPAGVPRVDLERFPEPDTATLLAALAGRAPPAPLVRTVHAETEGNPFFVHEVYRYLAAAGRLVDERGAWRPSVQLGEVDLPPSVRLVLDRRLALVSASCRHILSLAAVIGRTFTCNLLGAVAGMDEEDLLAALDEAERRHLLESAPEDTSGRMSFAHELIRQTLLAGLSLPHRQRLHQRVAEAIERVNARTLDQHLATLAVHYRQAGTAGDVDRAIDYSLRAGAAARGLFAYEAAASHWQAGLEMMEEQGVEPEHRASVLERLGDLMLLTGIDRAGGIAYAERALVLFEQSGRQDRVGVLHSKLAGHFSNFPMTDIPRALAHFRAAEETWQDGTAPAAHAYLYAGLASAYTQAVRTPEGLVAAQRAMEIAEGVKQEGAWAHAAALKAWHLVAGGHLAEGVDLFERAWETGDRLTHVGSAWVSAWVAGVSFHLLGDPLVAQGWVRRELDRPRLAEGASRRVQLGLLGYWQVESGHLDDARQSLAAAAAEAWIYFEGLLKFREGDWAEAASRATHGREVAVHQGDRFNIALAGFDLAKVLATTDRIAEAETLLHEGLVIALDGSSVLLELWARQGLALLYAETGRLEEARPHLARCREILARGEDWRGLDGRVAVVEAAVAAAEGRLEEADTAFQRAVDSFGRYTLPWDEP
jgi:tetratricopeptide (TPR) repeat protein